VTKVALVCAFNPGNTGMYSVDLAASRFMRTLGVPHRLINFQRRPWRPVLGFRSTRDLKYLKTFTHLLFWGDFQNNPVYGTNDFAKRELKFNYASSDKEAISNWSKLHLDISDELHGVKIASVGNCFLGAGTAATEKSLVSSLRNFVRNAVAILPRESQSMQQLMDASEPSANIAAGLDTAFLLDGCNRQDYRDEKNIGFRFVRSGVVDADAGIAELAKATGLSPIEIPWTTGDRKASCKKKFSQAMDAIATCRVVVTDVYHLTVNATNHGTPVICLSRGDYNASTSVADAKKHALSEQIGTLDLHVTLAPDRSLLSTSKAIVDAYQSLMDRQIDFDDIMQGLQTQKSGFRDRIIEIIES
jgi:hypothetical protein